jgi:hypothetical protein
MQQQCTKGFSWGWSVLSLEYVSSGQNNDVVFKCLGSLGNLALCKVDLCDVLGKTACGGIMERCPRKIKLNSTPEFMST